MNRYQNIPVLKSSNNRRYFSESKFPKIPLSENDIWVITTSGDRYDTLAQQYYGDKSLWWIISTANDSLEQNSLYPPLGTQIRIPIDTSDIIFKYEQLNSTNTQTNSPQSGEGNSLY